LNMRPALLVCRSMFTLAIRLFRHAKILSVCALTFVLQADALPAERTPNYLSPAAIATTTDGRTIYIACATANIVQVFDTREEKVTGSIPMPASPTGLALSRDGSTLFVTCAAPESTVCLVDVARRKVARKLPAGHTAQAPVLSPDEKTLYVCNRFNDEVAVIDLNTFRQVAVVPVAREPQAAAVTQDGRLLLVANLLHNRAVEPTNVAAVVSVIDTGTRQVVKELELPNGSGLVMGLAVSPDGNLAAVTHNFARFNLPTTQLDRGWMNTSALTLIDLGQVRVLNTVLLDNVDAGAANPWAVSWTADGKRLVVSHAGTHELSVIDSPALLEKLRKLPITLPSGQAPDYNRVSNVQADVPNDLAFLVGLRQRVQLQGKGPRSLVLAGEQAWVGNYFSDSLEKLDLSAARWKPAVFALGPEAPLTPERRGEIFFHDATLCFQRWQSCATCHPGDARVDGLTWDLLNDGIGNPKKTKTLLLAHRTPPAMSMGVRESGEQAVRAGFRKILFTVQPEEIAVAVDEYLKSLKPVPSPYLENGRLSKAAKRGKKLFESAKVGCVSCHPNGLFTDLQTYDVGTGGRFDTPTLVEVWRTAPYLHNGTARTIRDLLTTKNSDDQHGKTSQLGPQEIEDLAAYVLSL
jgi:YVTN family beta-propeller protein